MRVGVEIKISRVTHRMEGSENNNQKEKVILEEKMTGKILTNIFYRQDFFLSWKEKRATGKKIPREDEGGGYRKT